MKFKYEPALVIGFGTAVLALLVTRGLLSTVEAGAWTAVISAGVAALTPIAQALVTRFFVTPAAKLDDAGITTAEVESRVRKNGG